MAMSKLDFITILIVAICVAALGFLVYKTVGIMGPENTNPPIVEQVDEPTDTTTIEDEYAIDDEGDIINDDASTNKTTESTTTDEEQYPVDGESTNEDDEFTTTDDDTSKPSVYDNDSSTGKYLVLAGSYTQKINAENQVSKLKKMGYDDAAVKLFNHGALAVALVARFDNYGDAAALKKELAKAGIDDVFIKKKK